MIGGKVFSEDQRRNRREEDAVHIYYAVGKSIILASPKQLKSAPGGVRNSTKNI